MVCADTIAFSHLCEPNSSTTFDTGSSANTTKSYHRVSRNGCEGFEVRWSPGPVQWSISFRNETGNYIIVKLERKWSFDGYHVAYHLFKFKNNFVIQCS